MSNVLPGEIIAIVNVDDEGTWRTAAIAATRGGPVVGVLTIPENGGRGQIGFEPVTALQHGLIGHEAMSRAGAEGRSGLTGTDPDDPRGLRSSSRSRRPGMTS